MTDAFQTSARRVIEIETSAVKSLEERIDERFSEACRLLMQCEGRVVVSGMGKSGHVGRKIAATLASTGTPAFFVHPGEASHGDLGMITGKDVVIALSNSGNVPELVTILPLIKRMGAKLISMTGNPASPLAQQADINLDVGVKEEACPLGLAPTSSTTVALVMGDALAVALLEARGFTAEDFAMSHPGGSLGRRLLLKVRDIMHSGERLPAVSPTVSVRDTLIEMSRGGMGMAVVQDAQNQLLGIFTDGDLRRMLDQGQADIRHLQITEVMTRKPKTIGPDLLAAEALHQMEEKKINAIPVVDSHNTVLGAISMHDLLRAGVL